MRSNFTFPACHTLESDFKATTKSFFSHRVFRYNFDVQGSLTYFKARNRVRGDLREAHRDAYAATLASEIFRSLAIVDAFEFEMITKSIDIPMLSADEGVGINERSFYSSVS